METLIGLNSAVLVVATLCIFAVAYRFYGLFIASRVLKVDPARRVPSEIMADEVLERVADENPG